MKTPTLPTKPACLLRVVSSSMRHGELSLRGPLGRGMRDAAQTHITAAGFEDGDEVVVLRVTDYEALLEDRARLEGLCK